jgi:putative hydrolase of the HAD superfamily
MIKAVIFDLGRVLVPFDFHRGYLRLEALCGIPAAEIPAHLAGNSLVTDFESGKIAPRDFAGRFCSHLNVDISYQQFCDIWSSIFLPDPLIPEAMLQGIARNYPLVLLSNTNAIHFEMLMETYPLMRHFHSYVLSYKVGALKPRPVIYQKAIEAAGCQPGECFFTDDIEAYVDAARAQGIDAVQFQSAAQIEAELHKRGVRWQA